MDYSSSKNAVRITEMFMENKASIIRKYRLLAVMLLTIVLFIVLARSFLFGKQPLPPSQLSSLTSHQYHSPSISNSKLQSETLVTTDDTEKTTVEPSKRELINALDIYKNEQSLTWDENNDCLERVSSSPEPECMSEYELSDVAKEEKEIAYLTEILLTHPGAMVRLDAVKRLGQYRNDLSYTALLKAPYDLDPNVRHEIVKKIPRLLPHLGYNNSDVRLMLVLAMSDRDGAVASFAAQILDEMDNTHYKMENEKLMGINRPVANTAYSPQ